MSAKAASKRRLLGTGNDQSESSVNNAEELFVDAPPDESEEENDDDTTDSEESEYSGLEEEESDSADEEASDAEDEEASDEDEEMSNPEKGDDGEEIATSRAMKASQPRISRSPAAGGSESADENGNPVPKVDEYEHDSSDEEDLRNTIGNIPVEWYREYSHIGYGLDGKKILKPVQGDDIDDFLKKMEDPNYWRTVKDKSTGQNVILSDKDVELIKRFRKGKYVDPAYDPYAPWVDFFTHEVMQHPVTNRPEDKRSFIPSLWEKKKVGQMVHAIKMGWLVPPSERKKEEDTGPTFYNLWDKEDPNDITQRFREHIPAPKMALPGHAESYNPPPEYLLTEPEELAWQNQDPEERKLNFLPKRYSSLRLVPGYSNFIKEQFERCLDLYLCPRQRKMRMNVNPEDLIPKLPKPQELRPFPTVQAMLFKGHTSLVRSISVDPTGQWLVSGGDDCTVRFWEISSGRCMKVIEVDGVARKVAWSPNAACTLVAVCVDKTLLILNPNLGDRLVVTNTDNLLESVEEHADEEEKKSETEWMICKGKDVDKGFRIKITHPTKTSHVAWHGRGDYLAVVCPEGQSQSVFLHQVSKRRSQRPFKKSKGLVQSVVFHPTKPVLFVATQRYIRVYHLLKQELMKKLMANCKWVSCIAVHPGGDNLIVGSYDCRLSWFDLDLSAKPYQTLRHHKKAIRQVAYHPCYPLFASASDDGTVIVCHGRVYNDLMQNPLVVPVKVLRGHEVKSHLGVLDCVFHPTQPWIFTAGSDSSIRLYS